MSKLLLCYFVAAIYSLSAYTQDKGYKIGLWGAYDQHPIIVKDYIDKEGTRFILGSKFIFTIKNSSLNMNTNFSTHMGLSYVLDKSKDTFYLVLCLSAKERLHSWKDYPLLLKLTNDSIIDLKQRSDSEDKIGRYITNGVREYEINCFYEIDIHQLKEMSQGIKKIRFKMNDKLIDIECYKYKKDDLADFLTKETILLLQAVSNDKSDNLYEGF